MNTPAVLAPEQLPQSNAQFIAYGPVTRVADPFGGDDPVNLRPQTFVRYYRGLVVRELGQPRNGSDDTIKVVFDPTSVGLKEEFTAYMNADDPVVPYLREQVEAGNPMDIGLESVRRKKAKADKAEIPPYTPIHALRGANSPDGAGEAAVMMGVGGNHILNRVAVINGRRTTSCVSDPTEWALLTSNRKGDLPPEGYRALLSRDDWKKVGAITPKDPTTPPTAGQAPQAQQQPQAAPQGQQADGSPVAGIDPNALVKMIQHAVHAALRDIDREDTRAETATRGNVTPAMPRSGRPTPEPKQWVPWVTKDVPNAGSYIAASDGYAGRWAYAYLLENTDLTVEDPDVLVAASTELADLMQAAADDVQARLYDGAVAASRTDPSHKEAVMWVRTVVERNLPFSIAEDFDGPAWAEQVAEAAYALAASSMDRTRQYLVEQAQKQVEARQAGSAQSPSSPSPQGDRGHALDALAQVLGTVWNDPVKLKSTAQSAADSDLMGEALWADPRAGKFSTTEFEGARQMSVGQLTRIQYRVLTGKGAQSPSTPPEAPSEEAPPVDDHAPEPEDPQSPPPPADEPAATAPQGAPVAAPQTGGYPTAQHLAAKLAQASTEEQVAALFQAATTQNYLTAEVAAMEGVGAFGVSPVRPTEEGAQTMTLGQVFNAIQDRIANPAPTEDPAPAGNQEKGPEPSQEAPQTDDQPEGTPDASGSRTAQDIAEDANQVTDPEAMQALIDEATTADLLDTPVTIGRSKGGLGQFLNARMRRVSVSAAGR